MKIPLSHMLIIYMLCFSLRNVLITRGGSGSGLGSCFGSGTKSIDERLREFILAEFIRGILDPTPVLLGTIKEGIMDLMDERISLLRADIVEGHIRARTPSFREFKACGAPEFFGAKDPIASRRWIDDIENA